MRAKLVKLEHEISGFAAELRRRPAGHANARKRRRHRITIFESAKRRLSGIVASCKAYGRTFALSLHHLVNTTIRGTSVALATPRQPRRAPQRGHLNPPKEQTVRKSGWLVGILLATCFGLISIFGLLSVVLVLEVRNLKSEMVRWKSELVETRTELAESKKRIREFATSAQPGANSKASTAQPQISETPFFLTKDDKKLVRQFIKVLPPKPGAMPNMELGTQVPFTSSAPIPAELIEQIPKLRGARFAIDQNGSVVILAEGSSRADAIIEYQQPR